MDEIIGPKIKDSNPILYNFISLNSHVESLCLYQLENANFIPQYIIDLCDDIVKAIKNDIASS